uniref:ER membrane protein complex subunit 2 n=1 Tax=Wollemia nobilis TaxID=56998 RepID=A0A0C9RQJ8_9CONI
MVGVAEEAELNRLESQVENGGGEVWEYLCLVKKLKVRRSDMVLRYGLALLKDSKARSKLGGDVWTLYEQVAIAAMDCRRLDVAKDCVQTLMKKFPDSIRVGRLEGMWFEAKGSWDKADKIYSGLLEEQPLDPQIHKRKIAIAKAQGNLLGAVEGLNKYLEIYMADHDAWRELADLYISLQMYKQAAFCFEELIVAQPSNPLFHLSYAEVLYTLGGLENLKLAKKYYAAAINLTGGKNTKALYGVCLCGVAINQLAKGRSREEKESPEIQSLAAAALIKDYKQRSTEKAPLVTSILEQMKAISL